ncbi:hypothetical protein ASD44_01930 [Mesorhizobium sp. Root554]|uniref:DUF2163 domain-containing protein n=1 Tax=unclassified Mesorhizobium TaxID=325217 RepID=UPI0006F59962|nr:MULTISPECIES: DUF2163 domain-containing protein [unclassified Mesorhizobium]KQZ12963.1 hypothetical protein ASD27_01935 [Mesorhizobium sp. Root1471]KQZ35482.1 hypothetical protein ASD44_01930 [Mesorhizobium sp. Root554]
MTIYPEALAAHFGRDVTTVCHCWRLTRKDGSIAGFTDHDRALAFDATVFEPETGFSASEARDALGLGVDTVDVEGALSSDRISDEDIAAGLYDGARIETFIVNWRTPDDFACTRVATIGKITRSDGRFVAELESLVHALDRPNGRTVLRTCDAEVGDARCGFVLDQPGFVAVGTVASVSQAGGVYAHGLDLFDPGWFAKGLLTWTGGARTGRSERLADHRVEDGQALLVLEPSVGPAIAAGDAFSLTAGCDKAFATCKAKFANALNFRGFPHLPGNDAAYSYVIEGGKFDGGPIVP